MRRYARRRRGTRPANRRRRRRGCDRSWHLHRQQRSWTRPGRRPGRTCLRSFARLNLRHRQGNLRHILPRLPLQILTLVVAHGRINKNNWRATKPRPFSFLRWLPSIHTTPSRRHATKSAPLLRRSSGWNGRRHGPVVLFVQLGLQRCAQTRPGLRGQASLRQGFVVSAPQVMQRVAWRTWFVDEQRGVAVEVVARQKSSHFCSFLVHAPAQAQQPRHLHARSPLLVENIKAGPWARGVVDFGGLCGPGAWRGRPHRGSGGGRASCARVRNRLRRITRRRGHPMRGPVAPAKRLKPPLAMAMASTARRGRGAIGSAPICAATPRVRLSVHMLHKALQPLAFQLPQRGML
mmetsp:Transcript_14171/g.38957  ORF Transcript_14171/g.38957 Transcript_14171/m.38957 type:complete len:349 (+) Transcript_14171:437-1483(+)